MPQLLTAGLDWSDSCDAVAANVTLPYAGKKRREVRGVGATFVGSWRSGSGGKKKVFAAFFAVIRGLEDSAVVILGYIGCGNRVSIWRKVIKRYKCRDDFSNQIKKKCLSKSGYGTRYDCKHFENSSM